MTQFAQNARTPFAHVTGSCKRSINLLYRHSSSFYGSAPSVATDFVSLWRRTNLRFVHATDHANCIHVEFPALSWQLCNFYLYSAFNLFADGFLCNSTGSFPDQNDCRKFYDCYRPGKNAFHDICPSHSPFYHAENKACISISGGMIYYNITFS